MEFVTAESVEHGLNWLAERGDQTLPIAGGTDVMIQLAREECAAEVLLSLSKLEAPFNSIEFDAAGDCRVGASVTHRTIATDIQIRKMFPALATAAATVGGYQTQWAGTIGGNICNASPAADLLPPLLTYDASVELIRAGVDEPRRLKLSEFLVGRRSTRRESAELVSAIVIPAGKVTRDVYLKVGRRSATEVAIVGLAVRVGFSDTDNVINDIAVATCAVDAVARRVEPVEELLLGNPPELSLIQEAGRLLSACSKPIDDRRGTAAYRHMVLPRLLQSAIAECCQRPDLASDLQR